ncbi:NAD(P)-dependent dehydrogenase (short-subunit alcohol dehydrogenase family) [Microbacterium sp. W4I4]|uniref:SDR family NAD(P)-dependent oxidoreductase n=1 Tax=Microbacterium sp. W4I4 TaxID=3042295 RepID=UPI002787B31C|nr:SDR family NAD(P)-dependent oxidoreductase [Microbacterium sp. W4I4]MDQ0615158.1 NAD(P)-dependent dehydrogenase (short-subunit alcohol dehydrogenase family) [Microbacterium sp. W4I4]
MQKQRTVLVTGAAGGMCRGINARLGAGGHRVICTDLDPDAAERAAQAVRDAGGMADAFAVDVSDPGSVRALAGDVRERVGEVDVLINAAGILDRKYLADHDDRSFERTIDVNLVGPFRMIQTFAPAMVERGWGRIINVSSIAGVTGYPYPSYAASKAGLSNLARSLVIDFWGTGVTVNSICPGVVDTPMVIQEVRDQVPRKVPTGKIVDPDEIGGVALFLIGEDAKNINGADILVDGGATRYFQLFDRP